MEKKRRIVIVLVALLVLIGVGAALRWSSRNRNVIAVSGRIEGDESILAARTAARVGEITVREGDSVKKGQLLAVLTDDQVKAREDQAEAALAQAEAKETSAREQIAVLEEQLQQSGLTLGQSRLDTEGRLLTAEQQVTAADAVVAQARAREQAAAQQIEVLQEQLAQSRLAVTQASLDARGRVQQAEQQLAAAQAALAQAEAQYDQARVDNERYSGLLAEGNVTRREAELIATTERTQRAAVDAARKQVLAARGALTAARANLSNPAVRRSQEIGVERQILAAREDLAAARATVAQAQAQRAQASGSLTTTRAIATNPQLRTSQLTAARRQLDQARAELAAARATARQAQGKLDEARADRRDLKVLAPYDGVIQTRAAEPGDVVVNGTPLLTMLDPQRLYLRAYVPEGDIGRVKLGQAARVYLDSDPRTPLAASVIRIDPNASFTPENTYFQNERVKQVVGVKLLLENNSGGAKPGMPADGEIVVTP